MSGDEQIALRMHGVRKAFGPVVALDGVDLEVRRGEVHTLIGENGAGKSTLMKVLSGALAADGGTMELYGTPYAPRGPLQALSRGIAMIYQELNLAPHLSVEQNVMLGREQRRFGFAERRRMRPVVAGALEFLDHPEIAPQRRVLELGPGARQLVEIARAIVGDVRVLVMDEPTSSLSGGDAERLFAVVARLRERGVSIIYISHFLEEAQRIGDRFTVLRDGRTVGTGTVRGASVGGWIELMTGRDLEEVFPRGARQPGEVVLEIEGLSGPTLPRRADLVLRRGEIVGIAGLVGAGRTEFLRALYGLEPVRSGRVRMAGAASSRSSPRRSLALGVGLLSEDRKAEGLASGLSIATNTTLSRLAPVSRHGWIRRGRQDAATRRWIDRLNIRCLGPAQSVGALSGGNQQKVQLARLLHHDVDVLLLDEPTRGIDVASKVEIYRLMGELARQQKAILMVSSYLPELLGVCDRIAVMHRGSLGALRRAADWTEQALLDEATRGAS